MQSTPGNNGFDPILTGQGQRKRQLTFASPLHGDDVVKTVVFKQNLQAPKIDTQSRWHIYKRGWHSFDSCMKDRLVRNLRAMTCCAYFGGMGGVAHILSGICAAVSEHLEVPIQVPTYADCDMSKSRRTMLENILPPHKPIHLFGKIEDRMPQDVRDQMKELEPAPNAWIEANRSANKSIEKLAEDTYDDRLDECGRSYCYLCKQACEVVPGDDDEDFVGKTLLCCFGGINCKNHSAFGDLDGDAGKGHVGHLVYTQELKHRPFKLGFTECTYRWNSQPVASKLVNKFDTYECKLDPTPIGERYNRTRTLATSVDRHEVSSLCEIKVINNVCHCVSVSGISQIQIREESACRLKTICCILEGSQCSACMIISMEQLVMRRKTFRESSKHVVIQWSLMRI